MEQRDISILKLLETIERDSAQTQRELAVALGLSLGAVNKLLKDIAHQGLLKAYKQLKNMTRYRLTSNGIAEKIILKKKHLSHHICCYNEIKTAVRQELERLNNAHGKRLLLYGANELCEITLCVLSSSSNSYEVVIIDDKQAGRKINGYLIHNEAEIANKDFSALIIMNIEETNETRNYLISKGIFPEKIASIVPRQNVR